MTRVLTGPGREGLKYYEAGLDLGLSHDPQESYRLFQKQSNAAGAKTSTVYPGRFHRRYWMKCSAKAHANRWTG